MPVKPVNAIGIGLIRATKINMFDWFASVASTFNKINKIYIVYIKVFEFYLACLACLHRSDKLIKFKKSFAWLFSVYLCHEANLINRVE